MSGKENERQAVLLIHGIGEQKPMGTLRGFVDAVWTSNKAIHHKFAGTGFWSKPDNLSRSFELRRLTTPQNVSGIRTDFYEFYWAHMMKGTSYGHVFAWLRSLLFRRPSTVPRQLKSVYWLMLFLLAIILAVAGYAVYSEATGAINTSPWLSVIGTLLLGPLAGLIVLKFVGDAARYLHVAPANIQSRHEIRQAGVALLKDLHDPKRGYSRIIVVGHSLGSFIGYDILTHAWVDYHDREFDQKTAVVDALNALESLAVSGDAAPEVVQTAQRKYFEELKANGSCWRITDFVTLGSPLTYAALLLAKNATELERKQEDREFPVCLPALERVKRDGVEVRRFSFEQDSDRRDGSRLPHHAAVFGPTRWTNLYFPSRALVWGDLASGPLKDVMGKNILDVPVATRRYFGFMSHTQYWKQSPGSADEPHIQALRDALDLADRKGAHP